MFFRDVMNILNSKGLQIISPNYKYSLITDNYVVVHIFNNTYMFSIEDSVKKRKLDKCINIDELENINLSDGNYLIVENYYYDIVGILVKMEERYIEFCYLLNTSILSKRIFTNYGLIDKNDPRFMLINI